MKKVFFLSCLLTGISFFASAQEQKNLPIRIEIDGKFHKPRTDCTRGFGLCNFKFHAELDFDKNGLYVPIVATLTDNMLTLEFKTDLTTNREYSNEDRSQLVIGSGEEYSLSKEMSKAFGRETLKVTAGNYKMDYTANKFGSVTLVVE